MRSVLFLSAEIPSERLPAETGEADALILDLEDLVAPAARPAARAGLAARVAAAPDGMRLFVRVNGLETPLCFDDVEAAVGPGLAGLVFPKVESLSDLHTADWTVRQFERRAGLEPDRLELLVIVETAVTMNRLPEWDGHRCRRPARLGFGIGDLGADLNLRPGEDEAELAALRTQVVVASRAAGFLAPIDAVFLDTSDEAGLRQATARAVRFGFAGKFCLDAGQAAVVNDCYMPTAAELATTQQQLDAYEAALAQGLGAVAVDGVFVDAPVAARLRRILERGGAD